MELWRSKAKDLQESLNSLSLSSEGTEASKITEKILVGKVLSSRSFRRFTVMEILKKAWILKGKLQVCGLPSNLLHPETAFQIGKELGGVHQSTINRFLLLLWVDGACVKEVQIIGACDNQNKSRSSGTYLWTLVEGECRRRGLSFLSALEAHRREEVRALELGDLENEMLEWLGVGRSLMSPAHSPRIIGEATNVLQKKRVMQALLEDGKRMGRKHRRIREVVKEYSEPTDSLNLGEEVTYVDSREREEATAIDEIVSDLQAVEIQVQSTFSPPSNFKLGSSSGRYFIRSQIARSRRSWKDLTIRNIGVENGSGESSLRRREKSNNEKEKRDFQEAEVVGQYMPPLFYHGIVGV
ncbi:hypothetical protein FNV43_RR15392 [Rhamnella rubrinervis]|uniref:Uncharacterized protein n=1 Tax=Rhamnella rubrinervis TaxID=2594499 RepID=A0A8K0GXE8_9ROSA|nr:hypothetical protein FNV43_RR15392 [Rhamnella rubrinervis]